jgi:hypothetical protein
MTTGCPDRYKDMLAVEEGFAEPTQRSAAPRPVGPGGALCSYTVAPDDHGDRIGHLSSARLMTAQELDRINAELATVSADPSCSRHGHTRFALLGQSDTLVAVDGCAVQQDGGWWRATDALRALVAE